MSLKDSAHNDAISQTDFLREKFGGDITKLNKNQLVSYMSELLALCENGTITRSDCAFLISETYWSPIVRDDTELDSIVRLASLLEVPSFIEPNNPNEHWAELIDKVDSLLTSGSN
jgi:hypothetical protein